MKEYFGSEVAKYFWECSQNRDMQDNKILLIRLFLIKRNTIFRNIWNAQFGLIFLSN